jgi:hypothetical protein
MEHDAHLVHRETPREGWYAFVEVDTGRVGELVSRLGVSRVISYERG